MVFELLEKMGDVIKSSPTVEKLEEEDFDQIILCCFSNKWKLQKMFKRN